MATRTVSQIRDELIHWIEHPKNSAQKDKCIIGTDRHFIPVINYILSIESRFNIDLGTGPLLEHATDGPYTYIPKNLIADTVSKIDAELKRAKQSI